MDNEKMNGIELTDKDLEQVSGGQVSEECAKAVKEKTDVNKLQSRVITPVGNFAPDIREKNDGETLGRPVGSVRPALK